MTDNKFKIGLYVTIFWVLSIGVFLYIKADVFLSMTPNEWGDFFAGCFSPLAFLWLILGYLQQGEELRLSTRALHLQAEELRSSVEQQRELVEVTRQQVENERITLRNEKLARKEGIQPRFVFSPAGGSFGSGSYSYNYTIKNLANYATKVVVQLESQDVGNRVLLDVAAFDRESAKSIGISVDRPFPLSGAILRLSYIDADGDPRELIFNIFRSNNHDGAMLEIERIIGNV